MKKRVVMSRIILTLIAVSSVVISFDVSSYKGSDLDSPTGVCESTIPTITEECTFQEVPIIEETSTTIAETTTVAQSTTAKATVKQTTQPTQEQTKAKKVSTYTGRVEFEGDVNHDYGYQVETMLSYLPNSLVNYFWNSGWRIVVTNDVNSKINQAGEHSGVTNQGTQIIYIKANSDYIKTSLLHEFGHFFDWVSWGTWNNDAILSAYNTDSATFKSLEANSVAGYYTSCSQEFFAECFEYYFTNNAKLQQMTPNMYIALDSLIHNFMSDNGLQ